MADLEKHAIKRDKRFLVRLVLLLAIGVLVGVVIYGKMTSSELADCAAGTFGAATGGHDGQGTGGEPAPTTGEPASE